MTGFTSPGSWSRLHGISGMTYLEPLGPTAANGLSYEEILIGDGQSVSSGDRISMHYTGTYIDGNGEEIEFESSRSGKVNRGVMGATDAMPIIFPIGKGKVIEGWEQGILGNGKDIAPMNVGGQRKLTIPADLAYGKEGRGIIPGDQDLIFDMELLSISVESESFLSKFFLYGVPGVFGFLILNSIYLILTGQA